MAKPKTKFVLVAVAFRVPQRGELYLNKFNKIDICTETNYSRRAQKRIILIESWN